MGFDFWYTLVLLILMTLALLREIAEADVIIFGTLVALMLPGVISIDDALLGFANQGVLTIALLFIIAAGLRSTGVLFTLVPFIFGRRRAALPLQLLRFLVPVTALSAFTNNTSIVAALIPVVNKWTKDNGQALSRFLIPLSYAAILGGMCTLIGTSTNLVVHGFLLESGHRGFGFFELTGVGGPVAVLGLLYVCFITYRLLPDRREPIEELGEHIREFVVELKVEESYPGIGRSIEDAGLRHLRGLFLFQIQRGARVITAVAPSEQIHQGDRLFFTGLPDTILELQKTPGLAAINDPKFDLKNYDADEFRPFEVVISESSPLVGKSVRTSNFRSLYDSVILAIHRNGERVNEKVGDIVLRSGDTLLILADKDFGSQWYHSKDFFLVTSSGRVPSKPRSKGYIALAVFGAFVLLASLNVIPIVLAAALGAIGLVVTKCISTNDSKVAVDWSVLVVIASSLGIGKAVEQAGIAAVLADGIVAELGQAGVFAILLGLYFITNFYTEVITNNAAAALLFPVTIPLAASLGLGSPLPLAIVVAIAASASFATPIGYQTNLMVYGPGGYRFTDYVKAGLPLNVLVGLLTVIIVHTYYF